MREMKEMKINKNYCLLSLSTTSDITIILRYELSRDTAAQILEGFTGILTHVRTHVLI